MDLQNYNEIIKKFTNLKEYKLCFYNRVPDELMDEYTEFMSEIFSDIESLNPFKVEPTQLNKSDWLRKFDSDDASGAAMNMYLLLDSNGKIAACCSLFIDSYKRSRVRHVGGITAVKKEHRGKGFGKYLKALNYKMLLEVNKDFKFITTDTMPWNKYMYRINNEFGFRPYKQGYYFKLTKEFLKNYLKEKR